MAGGLGDGDEVAYRREAATLASWYEDNSLTLNTDKTEEVIVDRRKGRRLHRPLSIRGEQLQFPGRPHQRGTQLDMEQVKRAQQQLSFIRRLRGFGMLQKTLSNFYSCVVESGEDHELP